MGRQEIRVMSTRRGYLVPLTPSSVGENNWLFISVYKKNDINITNFLRHIFCYQHASSLDFSNWFVSSVHTTSNSKPLMDSESPTTCKDMEAHSWVGPGIVCSRGCPAAPLTGGMWFHWRARSSGNSCSISHSVRDLLGEERGLDFQRILFTMFSFAWENFCSCFIFAAHTDTKSHL